MGKGQILGHWHRHDVPPGVHSGLKDGIHHFFGLPYPDTNLPFLVSDHYNGSKGELFTSLDNLGDPSDLDDPLIEAIVGLLPFFAAKKPASLLELRVHNIDVIPEHGFAAVGGTVDLLVGGGDGLLGFRGKLVEGRRRDVALRWGGGFECDFGVRVEVVEEGSVYIISGRDG